MIAVCYMLYVSTNNPAGIIFERCNWTLKRLHNNYSKFDHTQIIIPKKKKTSFSTRQPNQLHTDDGTNFVSDTVACFTDSSEF